MIGALPTYQLSSASQFDIMRSHSLRHRCQYRFVSVCGLFLAVRLVLCCLLYSCRIWIFGRAIMLRSHYSVWFVGDFASVFHTFASIDWPQWVHACITCFPPEQQSLACIFVGPLFMRHLSRYFLCSTRAGVSGSVLYSTGRDAFYVECSWMTRGLSWYSIRINKSKWAVIKDYWNAKCGVISDSITTNTFVHSNLVNAQSRFECAHFHRTFQRNNMRFEHCHWPQFIFTFVFHLKIDMCSIPYSFGWLIICSFQCFHLRIHTCILPTILTTWSRSTIQIPFFPIHNTV